MPLGKIILVTGASGFIGQAVCRRLWEEYNIIALDHTPSHTKQKGNLTFVKAGIEDGNLLQNICEKYKPDVVIHCAGIAHQKIGNIDKDEYFHINSHASEDIAKRAVAANPDVHFVFLSSISVYGEDHFQKTVSEEFPCVPSSDYAHSKLDAEKRLTKLCLSSELKRLDILRLAPVYDSGWTLNLDKRVFAPRKMAYIKFGSGYQKMSAISRQNLVDFIHYRVSQQKDSSSLFCRTFNVCDEKPYSFSEIINYFKDPKNHGNKPTIPVPLWLVKIATNTAGLIFKRQRQWFYSCYDKLACDLVFDNKRMLATGFKPKHHLE